MTIICRFEKKKTIICSRIQQANAYREGPLAVAALEACLVVGDAVGGEEVDEMDGLVAGLALVLRAGERHGDSRR
jgi:hypothetical protein